MKLPFDFGVKLIFRLILPGFLLSLGFLPLLRLVLQLEGWSNKWEYAFVVMVILLGWAIIITDMPIFMLMEGRRFWPGFIKDFAKRRLNRSLETLKAKTEDADPQKRAEAWFALRGSFQMSNVGEYEVVLPSRLGNVLYAYETYSRRTYGLDAIFYWPRIWLKLDKDTREEIDNHQALVDSTVYAAFALFISALVWVLYAIAKLVIVFVQSFPLNPRIQYDLTLIDQRLPAKGLALLVATVFVMAGYFIYHVSLFLYAQFGEVFKSVFDVNSAAINISPVMEEIAELTAESSCPIDLNTLKKKEQFPIAARYLQYYRYRCHKCNALLKPDQIKTHICPPAVKQSPEEDLLKQLIGQEELPPPQEEHGPPAAAIQDPLPATVPTTPKDT
jgi:hypothetical protein